jgi:ABC-type glucose/galactose transport system permease subunit
MDALERTVIALGDRWSSTAHFLESINMAGLAARVSQLDVVLAAAGVAVLAWIGLRKGLRSAELAVVAIIIFQTATIVLNMRVDFERYYLPILLGEVVAIGSIVGVIASLVMNIGQPAPASATIEPAVRE